MLALKSRTNQVICQHHSCDLPVAEELEKRGDVLSVLLGPDRETVRDLLYVPRT